MSTRKVWRNWAGNQHSRPSAWLTPRSEDELIAQVKAAGPGLRVAGAGHSFTPIVSTDGPLMSLDGLAGVIEHDQAKHTARIWAGTRLRALGPELDARGLGLVNQGDIDHQALGGAVATGTHGTGLGLGCLSAAVVGLRMVSAVGEVIECSTERDPDMLEAARVSLGMLGVITQLTLQCAPAYDLEERQEVMPIDQAMATIDAEKDTLRHIELMVFPRGGTAIVKRLLPTTRPRTTSEARRGWQEDVPLWLSSQLSRAVPGLLGPLHRRVSRFISKKPRVGRSYDIFPSERRVRFTEMEYQIPAARGLECLAEVSAAISRLPGPVAFPLEYRYVAGDQGWLSPFHGGARASISVHQFHAVDDRPLFAAVEPIFRAHQGRPHWGKLHGLDARALAPLYPEWTPFHDLRKQLDPKGKLMTPALQAVFES